MVQGFFRAFLNGVLAATLALSLAGCSGGGGSGTAEPGTVAGLASGQLDPAYGSGGKASVVDVSLTAGFARGDTTIAVDGPGNAYVPAVNRLVKFDPAGREFAFNDAGYSPVTDAAGNVYYISGGSVAKRDATAAAVSSFGAAGKVKVIDTSVQYASLLDKLLLDGEGNVFVFGRNDGPHYSGGYMLVTKLDRNGQMAPDFGASGQVTTNFRMIPPGIGLPPLSVAHDKQGNLLVASRTVFSGFAAAKLDRFGNLAADFGTGGISTLPACVSAVQGLAVDASDNLYIGGTCSGRAVVFKLDSYGTAVSSFGNSGMATAIYGDVVSRVTSVLAGPAGTLYAAGSVNAGNCNQTVVAKLDMNGGHVASFGDAGIARPGIIVQEAGVNIAADALGRLYVGGPALAQCASDDSTPQLVVVSRLGG